MQTELWLHKDGARVRLRGEFRGFCSKKRASRLAQGASSRWSPACSLLGRLRKTELPPMSPDRLRLIVDRNADIERVIAALARCQSALAIKTHREGSHHE